MKQATLLKGIRPQSQTGSSLLYLSVILLLLSTIGLQAQTTVTSDRPLPNLTFAPHWLPQAQFAGFYVALEKGFYLEAGLDVDIIHPAANIQATSLLHSGKADIISLFLTTAITARSEGYDLVNVAQLSQHSAIILVAKKSSGIEQLTQLDGKKIGIWKSGFDEAPKALINQFNLDVAWIPILSTVNLFLMDGIDAMTVMWYNEYHQILQSGVNEDELTAFFLSEYDMDVPEDGLYCTAHTLKNRGSDVEKFVAASMRGWEEAAADPEFALDVVEKQMNKAHVPSNRAHQSWMLRKVLDRMEPGKKPVTKGSLMEADYQKALDVLTKTLSLSAPVPFNQFHFPVIK